MDIEAMKTARDIRGLIRLLDHRKDEMRWRAADALGSLGEIACDPLLKVLEFPKVHVRIGVIEALGEIKSPQSVEPLIHTLLTDEVSEVRWVAALALGEIGDKRALSQLVNSLKDKDRFVRHGSAKALEQLGWSPENDLDRAYYYLALQEWDSVKKLGKSAIAPIIDILKDPHPKLRSRMIEILGLIGGAEAQRSCERVLRDPEERVRWNAVLSSVQCGVPVKLLPREISKRRWTGPSAIGAALLNLIFLGCGYDYLGKWWGLVMLEVFLLIFILMQLLVGLWVSVIILAPITAILATQTYFMAKKEEARAG